MNSSIPKAKQKQYADYVKQITPTHSLPMNMAKAFLTGGVICVVGQIITNFAKSRGLDQDMAGTWCSVTLVFISVILTGFNIYPKIGKFGGAGSLVPVSYTHLDVYKRQLLYSVSNSCQLQSCC